METVLTPSPTMQNLKTALNYFKDYKVFLFSVIGQMLSWVPEFQIALHAPHDTQPFQSSHQIFHQNADVQTLTHKKKSVLIQTSVDQYKNVQLQQ
jgi:hypothetical protein